MSVMQIISGALLIIISVVITVAVCMQEPSGGLGATFGGDTFFGANKGRSKEAMLAKITKIAGAALFVITLIVLAFSVYAK